MIACYLDESGTDGQSPTAVVAGLLLQKDAFFWLDVEWKKALLRHGFDAPIHMKEFVPHGRFGRHSHNLRRALFSDLVQIINEHKTFSTGARVSTEDLRSAYDGVFTKQQFGVYGTCFLLLGHIVAKCAQMKNYHKRIPYVMDSGNQYTGAYYGRPCQPGVDFHPTAGSLTFDLDTEVRALQAADVVAWSVRRCITGKFNNGFEPLPGIFGANHQEQPFEKSWMLEAADVLRARIKERDQAAR